MMIESAKIENVVLKDPKNYAAIYARISSQKDNNSIDAQIIKGKTVINNKNLLLYAVYTDHVSGRKVSPPDRDGFGKLLADAKAGCFKTIIAYKHDRIARNLNDWVDLKAQLKKLGIKIIFSDGTEYTSDNSLQGDFIENLIMMVAELEPNNINERASGGRKQRRHEGVYNAANHIPFGYSRADIKIKTTSSAKSIYKIEVLKTIFIQKLFCEAKESIIGQSIEIEKIRRKITSLISSFLEIHSLEPLSQKLIEFAEDTKTKLTKEYKKEIFLQKVIEKLHKYLKETKFSDIEDELKKIKSHLDKYGNIKNILSNSVYGHYMLLDSNEKQQGIIIENNIPRLNENSFKEITNVAQIIDKKTFAKVYCYSIMSMVLKEEEPDYLFKGKLKCGNCGVYLSLKDGLLQCTNVGTKSHPKCKAYGKNNLTETVLDIIIDDALSKSEEGFNKFSSTISGKLEYLRKDLDKLRNTKMFLLKEYLINKSAKCAEEINNNQDSINLLLHKIANYSHELSSIERLQEEIIQHNRVSTVINKLDLALPKIKPLIISYIISNQDIFNSIFDKLIKEIKVRTIERKSDIKCDFTINYEFRYDEPGNIPKSIDGKARYQHIKRNTDEDN